MTTYSEKPLRIVGLTVLLSIDEHIVPFCPQKVYKKYTSSIHQLTTAAPAAPEPPAAAAKSTAQALKKEQEVRRSRRATPSVSSACPSRAGSKMKRLICLLARKGVSHPNRTCSLWRIQN